MTDGFNVDDINKKLKLSIKGLNYKESYNTKFTSYAYTYIFGEIVKYINESKNFKISKENRNSACKTRNRKSGLIYCTEKRY